EMLIYVVIQEQSVDQSGLIPREKDPISGSKKGLTIPGKTIGKPRARGKVVFGGVNHAGLGVIWIHDGRLGYGGIVVAQAKVQHQAGVKAVLVLPIEAIRYKIGVDLRVSETLGV